MIPAFTEECVKEAQVRGTTLPPDWSVGGVLEALTEAMMEVQPAVLKKSASLRRRGTLEKHVQKHVSINHRGN